MFSTAVYLLGENIQERGIEMKYIKLLLLACGAAFIVEKAIESKELWKPHLDKFKKSLKEDLFMQDEESDVAYTEEDE